MTNEEHAEWLIIDWFKNASCGDISISRRARDSLKRSITKSLVEASRQEIQFPSREEFSKWYAKDYPYLPNARDIYNYLKDRMTKKEG